MRALMIEEHFWVRGVHVMFACPSALWGHVSLVICLIKTSVITYLITLVKLVMLLLRDTPVCTSCMKFLYK